MGTVSKFEQKLKDKRQEKAEKEAIMERAVQEWPTMNTLNESLRYLEVFAQLMKIKPYIEWMKDNIEIHDQIDHEKRTIDVIVAYKGPGKLSPDEPSPEMVAEIQQAAEEDAEPLCPPAQNIVNCPNCQLTFDANVEVPKISLATEIPKDAPIPGSPE